MKKMYCRLRVLMAEQEPPLTQRVLMAKLSLSSHTISRLYGNKFKRVDREVIEKLCNFFDCPLEGDKGLFQMREIRKPSR
ncbi:MAG: helix-turn-helix transcriptional regulator [Cyanobacteria bacterium J06582_2]